MKRLGSIGCRTNAIFAVAGCNDYGKYVSEQHGSSAFLSFACPDRCL